MDSSVNPHVLVDLSRVGARYELETSDCTAAFPVVELTVLASACGKVLRAVGRHTRRLLDEEKERSMVRSSKIEHDTVEEGQSINIFTITLRVSSIGASLIADRPYRREFLSLYLEGLEVRVVQHTPVRSSALLESDLEVGSTVGGSATYLNLRLADIQIDNYSETNIHPVLLHTFTEKAKRKLAKKVRDVSLAATIAGEDPEAASESIDKDLSFLLISAVKRIPRGCSSSVYEYIACRILEFRIAIDSSTIQLYFIDLHADLVSGRTDPLAEDSPSEWVRAFNNDTVVPEATISVVNIKHSKQYAQANKMYIESLILHPIKIRLSYHHTAFPLRGNRSDDLLSAPEYMWLKLVSNIVSLDDVKIKLHR